MVQLTNEEFENTILENAPESFDGDESQDQIAIRYVRHLESKPDYLGMVREFHETFGHPVTEFPQVKNVTNELKRLRCDLIEEELHELEHALATDNVVEVADALADILYVTFGAALVFGIPIDEVFTEVQRSNMSKLGEDGKPIYREDGKILKGKNYSPPDILPIIVKHLE